MANDISDQAKGSMVFIDDDNSYMYDLGYSIRFINVTDYALNDPDMFLGFLCGLHAGNYDITHFFIDDLNKILDDRSNEALEKFLATLSDFSQREHTDFTITINADPDKADEELRKYF